jgi:hypothetical protein
MCPCTTCVFLLPWFISSSVVVVATGGGRSWVMWLLTLLPSRHCWVLPCDIPITRQAHGLPLSLLCTCYQQFGQCMRAAFVVHVHAGDLSRNRTVGLRLGKGETLKQIMGSMKAVAEGVLTSRSAHLLAKCARSLPPCLLGHSSLCSVLTTRSAPHSRHACLHASRCLMQRLQSTLPSTPCALWVTCALWTGAGLGDSACTGAAEGFVLVPWTSLTVLHALWLRAADCIA